MQLTVDSGQLIVIQLAVQFGSADTAVPLRGYGCGQNQLGLKLQGVGRLLILLLTTAIDVVVGNAHPTKKPYQLMKEHTPRILPAEGQGPRSRSAVQTTNNKQQITNNKQQTTNNKQQTTNNKQQTTNNKIMHIPVLKKELIEGLNIVPGGHYLDATVGFGGHSSLILATYSDVKVTAMDRDESALTAAQERLIDYKSDRLSFWQGNFADYQPDSLKFDGIIADLGVNSAQLDIGVRGFSFQHAAKLDMRMDRSQSLTAEKIINHLSERELGDIFYQYGEERFSRRIAKRIVERRPFYSTTDLAGAIASSFPPKYRYGKIHPATRVFQALRIYVNQELESLEKFIATAPQWLKVGGVIGIISFHSLEDRIVKHGFRQGALLEVLTKKPITPEEEEVRNNPRSRSAKLRFARRI